MDLKLRRKYKQGEKLGPGASGEIYIAQGNTSEQDIIAKIKDNQTQQHIEC